VMKNMGLQHLWLVKPHCDPLSDPARQMAVHGLEVLLNAQTVITLPEALVGCQRVMATTARSQPLQVQSLSPRQGLPWLIRTPFQQPAALVFGPEDRGLSNAELNYAQQYITIPAHADYTSLNLAQAVAVCCYELYQSSLQPIAPTEMALSTGYTREGTPEGEPSSFANLEAYYRHLEALLLDIGYLHDHTSNARMRKLRRLLNRAQPTEAEIAMLRGMLSQVEWALKHRP
jgi:tRNA/rRNA methyltransferase